MLAKANKLQSVISADHRGGIKAAETSGFSGKRLSQARQILAYSREQAEAVLAVSFVQASCRGCRARQTKRMLWHGNFERLFANHQNPVAEPVHCTPGTAQRFMAIASHPVLSKAAHGQLLPPSWRTLYELTKVHELTKVSDVRGILPITPIFRQISNCEVARALVPPAIRPRGGEDFDAPWVGSGGRG